MYLPNFLIWLQIIISGRNPATTTAIAPGTATATAMMIMIITMTGNVKSTYPMMLYLNSNIFLLLIVIYNFYFLSFLWFSSMKWRNRRTDSVSVSGGKWTGQQVSVNNIFKNFEPEQRGDYWGGNGHINQYNQCNTDVKTGQLQRSYSPPNTSPSPYLWWFAKPRYRNQISPQAENGFLY